MCYAGIQITVDRVSVDGMQITTKISITYRNPCHSAYIRSIRSCTNLYKVDKYTQIRRHGHIHAKNTHTHTGPIHLLLCARIFGLYMFASLLPLSLNLVLLICIFLLLLFMPAAFAFDHIGNSHACLTDSLFCMQMMNRARNRCRCC